MKILPVIDLLGGQVVRGIAGRRESYRPIVSRLTSSTLAIDVARAFRTHFRASEIYLADLDAISGCDPAAALYRQLLGDGFKLWVDAGVGAEGRNLESAQRAGVDSLIAGLESLDSPEQLRSLVDRFGTRLIFSLDLMDAQPLGRAEHWGVVDAWAIALQAIDLGVRRILVLDLAGVGVNEGSKTAEICGRLRADYPDLQIATGGGIRGADDLRQLAALGVDWALVASALHDSRLNRADVEPYLSVHG